MNHKGYTMREMIILCSVLAVIYGVAITKTSYAYQEAANTTEINEMKEAGLQTAAETYVKLHKDKFTESETYFFGKDLIEENLLINDSEKDYINTKIKVTHEVNSDHYQVEIVS